MKTIVSLSLLTAFAGIIWMGDSCDDTQPSSDQIQRQQQEKILKEGTAETGMPNITNFRERKLLKQIYEDRDKELVTYTYLENAFPSIIKGHTALGGKLTYVGQTVGYGIPYSTEYTSPSKIEGELYHSLIAVPQADPNGLFSPASAEGTWIMMKDPHGGDVKPIYIEPRITTFPFQLDFD